MTTASISRPGLKVIPLARETLQDRVHRRICDMILDGEIEPGQLVTIQSISEACGVSHMPVREALKRLMAANALTVVSGRSIGIPPLSRARLDDLRNVRIEVESLAGKWAARHITESELAALALEFENLKAANATGDVHSYLRANHAFHFAIYRAARSETLLSIIETLWLQISPYFCFLYAAGNFDSSNTLHSRMVGALKKRDEERLEKAIRADLDAAYHVLRDMV